MPIDRTNPHDFTPVLWSEVSSGDTIFLLGTHLNNFRAYGPHIVHDKERMMLENSKGDIFLQYQQILGKHTPAERTS